MIKTLYILPLIFLLSCGFTNQAVNKKTEIIKVINKEITNDKVINKKKIEVDEFVNYRLLSKYYYLISKGKLEEAYTLKYEPKITLEQFKNSYQLKKGESLHISKYEKISETKSEFEVWDMIEPQVNFIIYEVSAENIEGKINILETNKIIHKVIDEFTFEGGKLTSEWEKGVKNLYIDTNNSKKLIISKKIGFYNGRFDIPSYLSNFKKISFTDKHIIKFFKPSWEMGGYYEYDIYTDLLKQVSVEEFYGEEY